ncbi:hypothetical protein SOCEGT47_020960 [Sorangium cellulosum]|uniref:Uncharacterized protein n=1 Tax=Sorangium cellulosum TaxID=56 RepID=A0A4P2PXW9_SORCE|nr:hypothetical protein [Sorangium cellulosum]AUX21610.1 hypothetical protein SOCEGT47_020960 [Sorangium cellulosum]
MKRRIDRAPRLTRDDLSSIAEASGLLNELPGVRPWDPRALWRAVLDLGVRSARARKRKPRAWEHFQQAIGALKVLDALERHFLRK